MELTKSQLDAVEMLFDDLMTDVAIAEAVGVDERTLRRWKQIPEFLEEFDQLGMQYHKITRQRCLNAKARRLDARLDRYRLLLLLIDERANAGDPAVPGDCTGLIIKRIINTKNGVVIEARIDHALLRELARLEDEFSRECDRYTLAAQLEEPEFEQATEIAPRPQSSHLNRAARRQAERRQNKARHSPQNSGQNRTLQAA